MDGPPDWLALQLYTYKYWAGYITYLGIYISVRVTEKKRPDFKRDLGERDWEEGRKRRREEKEEGNSIIF